jgi:hypothetical protein
VQIHAFFSMSTKKSAATAPTWLKYPLHRCRAAMAIFKNGKKGFDGATKPKKILHPDTNSKPFVRNLFRFRRTKNGSVQKIRNL